MKTAKFVLRLTKKQLDLLMETIASTVNFYEGLNSKYFSNIVKTQKLYNELLKQTEKQRAHEIKIAENRKRLRNKRRILARRAAAKV